MSVKYIDQLNLNGKRVLIRVDYNVPQDKEQNITDDTRITATIKTINYCTKNKAKVILVSHLGRPDGKVVPKMSLKPAAKKLSEVIGKDIKFIEAPIGQGAKEALADLKEGEIALLENIRFYPEEEQNDMEFGKKLAELCDVYLDDAFACAHRGHASNEAITHFVSEKAAGFLLKDEIEYFNKAISSPERPLIAIIGGAKVSSKLAALNNVLNKVDKLIIGGGMAYTFLKAKGYSVGKSLLEIDLVDTAAEIMKKAEANKIEILLPVDFKVVEEFKNESPFEVVSMDKIPDNKMGLDIGPETIKLFSKVISNCKTAVWNGPMGVFEMPNFAEGTNAIARTLADTDCLSIIGGGDSVSAINQSGVADKVSYISTGGGAFLELLEGKVLPGIKALD